VEEVKKIYKQVGKTNIIVDKSRKAMPPAWRTSKTGHKYLETRRNRSDRPPTMV
jgi:hypothetical protein